MECPTLKISVCSVDRGSPVDIELEIDSMPGEAAVQLDVNFVNPVAGGRQASQSVSLPPAGTVRLSFPTDEWLENAVFRPFGLTLTSSSGEVMRTMSLLSPKIIQVREPGEPVLSQSELGSRQEGYVRARNELYARPLGDITKNGVERWQAVVLVEQLFMQTALLLPSVEIQPLDVGNPAISEAELIDNVMNTLLPGFRPAGSSDWTDRSQRARPVCVLQFENIYACSLPEADELLVRRRDEVLDLLTLNRRSAPRVIGTVLTQLSKGVSSLKLGVPEYQGNLATGELAGESQLALTTQDAAARSDPLLALVLSLLRSAHSESSPDFRYFRFWSVLEILADDRVGRRTKVFFPNGEPLLDQEGKQRTTRDAAPLVFVYLSRVLGSFAIEGLVKPAPDLWTAVRSWYDRRNAAAHSGEFKPPCDPEAKPPAGMNTLRPDGTEDLRWLQNLKEVVMLTAQRELQTPDPDSQQKRPYGRGPGQESGCLECQ